MYRITHPHAQAAIIAALNREFWGHWASRRYAQRHGVPMNLYILACLLQAAEKVKE